MRPISSIWLSAVWGRLLGSLASFQLTQTNPVLFLFQYIVDLVDGHYERLGWRDDGSHNDRRLRLEVLALACRNGHSQCLSQAGENLNILSNGNDPLAIATRQPLFH